MKKKLLSIYNYWLNWSLGAKVTSSILSVALISILVLLSTSFFVNGREATESIGSQWLILSDQILLHASEKVIEEIRVLETLARTPSLIAAVKESNQRRVSWTAEEIIQLDQAWSTNDPRADELVQEILTNQSSRYLMDFQKDNPGEVEVFITDAKGLNIAMSRRTSDFRQSDEDWWFSAFASGKGQTYLGPVEYDDSSEKYAVDIGIPIRDPETSETIGVLRGTIDISVMINALKNVRIGRTGNVVLVDPNGIVLYSHDTGHFLKPVPDTILTLIRAGQKTWLQSTDLDGKPSIVAYSSPNDQIGASMGWHLLFTQNLTEVNEAHLRNMLTSFLASLLVVLLGAFLSWLVVRHSMVLPIKKLTGLAEELSVGNIVQDTDQTLYGNLSERGDEMGNISRAFDRLILYFVGASEAATAIANKDLTIAVQTNSDQDTLGIAFSEMVEALNHTISQVAENAGSVSTAASQLAFASDQASKATSQIAVTIQQVASGTTQQSEELAKTVGSVDHMGQIIHKVARGAQEQSRAANHASIMTVQIASIIREVASAAQAGACGAREAAEVAMSGGRTIESTITGMQSIKSKVGLSAQKVNEMGQRSAQIDAIIETIDEIASQTDLLALNAAIEAARVESKSQMTVETMLQQHMLGAAALLAQLLASGYEPQSQDLQALARRARVQDFFVSDSDGIIIASTSPDSLGFRFSEDPQQQSSAFRVLLTQDDGIVVQPIQAREQDNKPYMFVGVSRRDRPGIVQVGMMADGVKGLIGYSRGFAVVADEIRKLSIHAKSATKEIAGLIRSIQKTIAESVFAMEDAARDVENRSTQASQARESLSSILKTVEMVDEQVRQIVAAVEHMDTSSRELGGAVAAVNAVIKENTSATEELAANSSTVRQAAENIASVSEENSAAVEEVSASTEEVLAQTEQVSAAAVSLMQMADDLQKVVAQFALAIDAPRRAVQD